MLPRDSTSGLTTVMAPLGDIRVHTEHPLLSTMAVTLMLDPRCSHVIRGTRGSGSNALPPLPPILYNHLG